MRFSYDTAREANSSRRSRRTPAIAAIALNRISLVKFRETIAQNINYMVTIYTTLAVIITFGVVYNSARIQLSERARELASLRVLGFTRGEVSWVLLSELAILTVAAIPLGWLFGYGFGLAADPVVLERSLPRTVRHRSRRPMPWRRLIVISAAAVSALIVRRRVDRLDLVCRPEDTGLGMNA